MLWRLPNISLAPDTIFYIGSFPVTNTLLGTWISIAILLVLFFLGTRRRDLIPSGMQNLMEWVVELLLGLAEGVAGKVNGRKFFPLVATFFVFIFVSNFIDIIPGVDTIGQIDVAKINAINAAAHTNSQPVLGFLLFGNISSALIPWIRPATTDLNLTIGMALIAVITAQVYGFATLGAGEHLSKYFNFPALFRFSFTGFVEFFVGILDIVQEIGRILSLAFRLFGNIFAGTVVLAVFAFIIPFVSDIVFIPFELFVAFVQAFVFALLSLIYLQLAVTPHAHAESEHEAHEEFERNEERATARHA
ncbi:MAG TPA: F0F1 ATP synthase subunit A [Ktedonobacteraceae bacterium]|nr:F0F1 ATP synthase subunit A [Ktedonobacteraceae bacterium]